MLTMGGSGGGGGRYMGILCTICSLCTSKTVLKNKASQFKKKKVKQVLLHIATGSQHTHE